DDEDRARVCHVVAGPGNAGGARAHRAAAAAQILIDHPVGAAERAHQQRDDEAAAEEGAADRTGDGERAVLLAHRRQAIGHFVERLVPGNFFPLPAAARSGTAARTQHARWALRETGRAADAFDAERALG